MGLSEEIVTARNEIKGHAENYGLSFFETVFEMVDYNTMNALASFGGFPVRYPHWRFGMDFDQMSKGYSWGLQKIYEMVINTNPVYAYLLNSNALVDQKTVMAHVYGHADFFKNNFWFSQTNRKMLDNMANHAVKIRDLMDQHGQDKVEAFIDSCLSLENLIDPQLPFQVTKREKEDGKKPEAEDVGRIKSDRSYMDSFLNPPEFIEAQKKKAEDETKKSKKFPAQPEKDVPKFLLDNAPLEEWERTVLAIIRDEAYYFLPQMQTKIMNEGWASFWHSRIMTQKVLKASEIIDFADHHAGTLVTQPGRVNPYKLGIELFRDIEDRWNRGKFGKDYDDCDDLVAKHQWDRKLGQGNAKVFEVRRVCNDVTFIDEYLTPEFVERHKLYTYEFNRRSNQYEIAERDFKKVKEKMLFMLTNMGQPYIHVTDGNFQNKGELLMTHRHQGVDLDFKWAQETLNHVAKLWRRPVNIETEVDGQKRLLSMNNGEFTERAL